VPGATPNYGLPYPVLGDQPHGPDQVESLAQATDALLQGLYKTERDDAIAAALAMLLANAADFHAVATSQNTTSTSYTDLGTVGPQVTLTSEGTRAIAFWALTQFTTSGSAASAPAVSGATTIAASDAQGVVGSDGGRNAIGWSWFTITPGSNTYTLKYRVSGGTGTFLDRRMLVFAP
jgi:hypothetical protein